MTEIKEVNVITRLSVEVESQQLDKYVKNVRDADNAVEELKDSTSDFEKGNKKAAKSTKKVSKETGELKSELKKLIGEYRVFGVSLNDVVGKLKKWQTLLVGSQRGLTGVSKGLGILKIALISTGIGLFIVALGSVAAFLTKTKKGADLLSGAMAGLGAAFSVIIDRASGLGRIIISAFSNPLQAVKNLGRTIFSAILNPIQTAKNLISGVKEIGEEMSVAAKRAAELDLQLRNLVRREKDLELQRAIADRQIKALNKDAEDTTLGIARQSKAAKKAFDLEQSFIQKEIQLQKERISIIREQQKLSNNLDEDDFRLKDEKIKLEKLITASLETQTTLQNKLNALQSQNKEAIKEEVETLESLIKKYIALETKLKTDLEPLALKNIGDELKNLGDRIKEIRGQLDLDLLGSDPFGTGLFIINIKKSLDEIDDLNVQEVFLSKILDNKKIQNNPAVKKFAEDLLKETQLAINDTSISLDVADKFKSSQAAIKEFEEAQADAEQKEKDQRQRNKQAALETLQSAKDLARQILQIEVDRIDAQIALVEGRVNKFKELAEQGSAEQLQLEEERLNELIEKREEAAERQRAVAAIEIATNNAVSISAALTSIISGFKSGDIVTGILNAVALAATIASTIFAVNNALSGIPAFAEGTERFEGVGTETSDSNIARLSKNERIVPAWVNKMIGYKFPNSLLPEAVMAYHQQPIVNHASSQGDRGYFLELGRKMDVNTKAIKGLSLQQNLTMDALETVMAQRAYLSNRANSHLRK